MTEAALAATRATFERILVEPTPADLWELQKELLVIGGDPAARARVVARAFHGFLRSLESKSASRSASRWGAVLGTAAVGSVSLSGMAAEQEDALERLLQSALPAVLEIGAAVKSAQAWEVEAGLIYDDLAWFLYDELWDGLGDAPGRSSPRPSAAARSRSCWTRSSMPERPTMNGPASSSTCSERCSQRVSVRCSQASRRSMTAVRRIRPSVVQPCDRSDVVGSSLAASRGDAPRGRSPFRTGRASAIPGSGSAGGPQ